MGGVAEGGEGRLRHWRVEAHGGPSPLGVSDGVKEEGCGLSKKTESRCLEGGGRGWSAGFYLKSTQPA